MEDVSGLKEQLKKLCSSQGLSVLATEFDGQPYSNLIAFAETDELKSLIFVTNRNTRKYLNAVSNQKVAIMIDSRTNQMSDFSTALAVTAIGNVEEATPSLIWGRHWRSHCNDLSGAFFVPNRDEPFVVIRTAPTGRFVSANHFDRWILFKPFIDLILKIELVLSFFTKRIVY